MTNASSSKMSIEDMIQHYQRSIERSQHDPKRILHCIGKLNRINVTVQHLQSTGIGRTVNVLRKDDGEIGTAAKALISKWKQIVASQESDGEDEEKTQNEQRDYDDYESSKVTTESISNSERRSQKTHEHMSRSSSSNSNHHQQHHHTQQQPHHHHHQHQHHQRDQYQTHDHEKTNDNHDHKRKYSSDDTQDHSTHSKHKHKSHSRDDGSNGSRSREQENNDYSSINRHKLGSKHKVEDRHHRSRHEIQSNGNEGIEKKHRNENKHHSKHSTHHKSNSNPNEKMHSSSKHKRSRESDDMVNDVPKKPKNDSSSSGDKSSKSKNRKSDNGIEIDQSMGTSFAEALGMVAPIPTSSKSDKVSVSSTSGKSSTKMTMMSSSSSSTVTNSCSSSSTTTTSSSKSKNKVKDRPKPSTSSTAATPSLLLKKPKLLPLEELTKDLPPPPECIIPNDYKPKPMTPIMMEFLNKGPKQQAMPMLSETAALCASTTSKNQRTKVYSGVKSGTLLNVPSLHELCIRFLQKNIDALEYTGGVPFEILRPVLERATSDQLDLFENYNPYLMEDSDVLWQQHCQRKFKAYKRQEMETWREMYYRCTTEQEARLNSLTSNIKKSQSVAMPVRQTKLAYVDSMVKPPRSIIKKQHQFGTHSKLIATPAARVESLSAVSTNIAKPGDARLKTLASMRDTAQAQSSNGVKKPKTAPLMAKTLHLMKGRFKR